VGGLKLMSSIPQTLLSAAAVNVASVRELRVNASRPKRRRGASAASARSPARSPVAGERPSTDEPPTLEDVLERLRTAYVERAHALQNARLQAFRLAELERWYVNEVVSACRGNRSMAARVLGLSRRSVQRVVARQGRKF
jgi:DNA-binding protein Fis